VRVFAQSSGLDLTRLGVTERDHYVGGLEGPEVPRGQAVFGGGIPTGGLRWGRPNTSVQ
jgi:hypothetical protein